jgi:hypothetical protein
VLVDAHLVQPVQQLHLEPTLALEPAAGPAAEAGPVVQAPAIPAA